MAPGPDGQVVIQVADNGPGISEAEKSIVTDRFYRGDGNAETQGTGLGLTIVEAIARLHKGRLTLKDNGPGLAASLVFPSQNSDEAIKAPN